MDGPKLRVLLVEASPTDAHALLAVFDELREELLEVTHVETLPQALDHAGENDVDVILIDLALPGMGGLQVLQELFRAALRKPVVVLSGHDDESATLEFIREGAHDNLVKLQLDGKRLLRSMRQAIERQRLENQRASLLAQSQHDHSLAEAALKARDQVLGVVAHDLRNPLNTISMSAALLFDAHLPEEFRANQLEVISRSIHRMDSLIQDLLDIAKIEGGHLHISPKLLLPSQIVAEALELNLAQVEAKSVRLESYVAADLPGVLADRNRVQQVFSNLIGNALKFTPAGGQISVLALRVQDELRFSVSDTGRGIPAEHLGSLFQPFWQAEASGRSGAGLGLAITKGIVEAHGGRIWVESTLGSGSTFLFTLSLPKESE